LRTDSGRVADGEAALRLAKELRADLVLINGREGRTVAGRLGLAVTGTIGIVTEVSLRGLADFEEAVALLRDRTNFRIDDEVLAAARRRLGEKRRT